MLPPRQLETLLDTLGHALEAGLGTSSFLHGAGAAQLPPPTRDLLARTEGSLAENFRAAGLLDETGVALVAAGERSGRLPEVLRQLARRQREDRIAGEKLRARLVYPLLLLVFGAVLMPLGRWVSAGAGAYARAVLPTLVVLLGVAALVFGGARWIGRGSALHAALRQVGRRLPVLGRALRDSAVARFCDTLGACLGAGLGAPESVRLAGAAAGPPYARSSEAMVEGLERGLTLADASAHAGLPRDVVLQVAAGEQAGRLPDVLAGVARDHRESALAATTRTVSVLGALLFAAVALQVARTVITTWTGHVSAPAQQLEDP